MQGYRSPQQNIYKPKVGEILTPKTRNSHMRVASVGDQPRPVPIGHHELNQASLYGTPDEIMDPALQNSPYFRPQRQGSGMDYATVPFDRVNVQ